MPLSIPASGILVLWEQGERFVELGPAAVELLASRLRDRDLHLAIRLSLARHRAALLALYSATGKRLLEIHASLSHSNTFTSSGCTNLRCHEHDDHHDDEKRRRLDR